MDDPTLIRLAQWFERRIDVTTGFDMPAARLYGLLLMDPSGLADGQPDAARVSFLADDADVHRLLAGSAAAVARGFDAAAVVTTGWAAPHVEAGARGAIAPSEHAQRRRIRVVAAVAEPGVRTVTRFADTPNAPVVLAERGSGAVIDALESLWFGDPFVSAAGRRAGEANARGCRRRT